mgnify:CR=1 FL=1
MDYVGIIIENEEGKMLFQLRDNKPEIMNRSRWGLFGGGIKENEKPIEAGIRELKEELSIKVKENQLSHFITVPSFKKNSYIFKLRLQKEINLKLREGASMKFFTISEILKEKNVVKSLRFLLLIYPFISIIKKG